MKILSFSYCFPTQANPNWGVFVCQRLAGVALRATVEMVAPVPTFPLLSRTVGDGAMGSEMCRGLTVHRPTFFYLPGILKSLDARFYARGLRRWLGEYIREWQPDVLDAHFVWPDGVGVSRLAKHFGLSYTITLRGKIYPCLEVPSQRRQCAEALRDAAAVISVDSRMADVARELGTADDRLHVIPNGVDLERFRPGDRMAARRELGLPEQGRLLVSVAHLGVRKGHRESIRALAQLPDDVRLVLVGGDPEKGRNERLLRELATELGLQARVVFVGPQPYDKIPAYYAAADIGLLASYREGCPNVVLESLASGRPVVVTDVGAVPDLITNGLNGRIVRPRDVASLADGLNEVLAREWQPEAVRNSPSVESWDTVAGRVFEVLKNTLSVSETNEQPGKRDDTALSV